VRCDRRRRYRRATTDASPELRRNLGEIIGLFPLPATEAAVESITQGGSSFVVVLRMVGETDEVEVQTRWKDSRRLATLVEASHLNRIEHAVEAAAEEAARTPNPPDRRTVATYAAADASHSTRAPR
jgi:hypothetical protein